MLPIHSALAEWIRSALLLARRVKPRLEFLSRLHGDKSPHPRVAYAAKLSAGDLVLKLWLSSAAPHLGGRDRGHKPDRDRQTGDRVLLHAKLGHAEGVDDVLAPELHDDRLVDRQIQLIERGDVVNARR